MKKNNIKPREIWLMQGLNILENTGPAELTIDNLVLQTGKTKGSFYYHFKNRNDYIQALLAYLETLATIEILDAVDEETGEIAQLKKLTALVFQISSRLEMVTRSWALYDPIVKEYQDRIDTKRLAHLKKIYLPSSLNETQAEAKAIKNYAIYIGLQQVKHLQADKEFKTLLKNIFVTRLEGNP